MAVASLSVSVGPALRSGCSERSLVRLKSVIRLCNCVEEATAWLYHTLGGGSYAAAPKELSIVYFSMGPV